MTNGEDLSPAGRDRTATPFGNDKPLDSGPTFENNTGLFVVPVVAYCNQGATSEVAGAIRQTRWPVTMMEVKKPDHIVIRTIMMDKNFTDCLKCKNGVLLPLSDYGRDGAPIMYKAWVCNHPECGFNIRIDNGEISLGRDISTSLK